MPETNYKAAVNVIERWKNEFPDTFEKLKKEIEQLKQQISNQG